MAEYWVGYLDAHLWRSLNDCFTMLTSRPRETVVCLFLAVMQSIELCKVIVVRASLCHGFMALKGSRALHNYSVLRNCNNASGV